MVNIRFILSKVQDGSASMEEIRFLLQYIEQNEPTFEQLMESEYQKKQLPFEFSLEEKKLSEIFERIKIDINFPKGKKRPKPFLKWCYSWKYWLSAACFLVIVCSLFFSIFRKKTDLFPTSSTIHKNLSFLRITNNDDTLKTLVLKDGSIVCMYPHAQITYAKTFATDNRNVRLSGKAIFKVVKDPMHPFTVYTGVISTTVLGTRFLIDKGSDSNINIKLFTGKIWIRKELSSLPGWSKDIIMMPGQQLHYSSTDTLFSINTFSTIKRRSDALGCLLKVESKSINDSIAYEDTNGYLSFRNVNLVKIFRLLSVRYNCALHINKDSIKDLYFSGQIKRSDSLPTILNILSNLNNLSYYKDSSGYYICRSKTLYNKDSICIPYSLK